MNISVIEVQTAVPDEIGFNTILKIVLEFLETLKSANACAVLVSNALKPLSNWCDVNLLKMPGSLLIQYNPRVIWQLNISKPRQVLRKISKIFRIWNFSIGHINYYKAINWIFAKYDGTAFTIKSWVIVFCTLTVEANGL